MRTENTYPQPPGNYSGHAQTPQPFPATATQGCDSSATAVRDALCVNEMLVEEVHQALRGTGVAADVIVWTRSALDARLHLRASFPSTVVAEGKLLYAA